jgi:hypothetical protein
MMDLKLSTKVAKTEAFAEVINSFQASILLGCKQNVVSKWKYLSEHKHRGIAFARI